MSGAVQTRTQKNRHNWIDNTTRGGGQQGIADANATAVPTATRTTLHQLLERGKQSTTTVGCGTALNDATCGGGVIPCCKKLIGRHQRVKLIGGDFCLDFLNGIA